MSTDAPLAATEPGAQPGGDALAVFEPFGTHDLCRLPRPDGRPWEQELVAADLRSAADARATLAGRLAGFEDLLAAPWASPPVPVSGAVGLLGAADPVGILDHLLGDHHISPGRLVVSATGGTTTGDALGEEPLQFNMSRPILANVVSEVRSGGAISLLSADRNDVTLSRALEPIERAMANACRLDLALVGAGVGLVADADDAGRLVIPIDGPVRVEARKPAVAVGVAAPMPVSLVVQPGDGIHLPAGWGHRVVATADPTTVVVVVLPHLTVHALATLLEPEVLFWPLLRADLPLDRHAPHPSYGGSVFDQGGMGPALAQLADEQGVGRLIARARAWIPARWLATLTSTLPHIEHPHPDAQVRVPLPGGVLPATEAEGPLVSLFGGGRRIRVEVATAAAIAHLADGRAHRVGELAALAPPDAPPDWPSRVARSLLQTGFAEVVA